MIPRLDAARIAAADPETLSALERAATGVGFVTVCNTTLDAARVREVIATYRAFFLLPEADKQAIDMARRGIHNEGARVLAERLEGKAEIDNDTARRLFTLICVLHFGG